MRTKVAARYALLEYSTSNLGDEIQSLAAQQFLPSVDQLVDRDDLNGTAPKERSRIILNGWFTHKPENWPITTHRLDPLFISFHISDDYGGSLEKLTDEQSIACYKKHEPIGCRDLHTTNLLRGKGVDAYFSGCLTLTLKNPFEKRTNNIYLVDVDDYIKTQIPVNLRKKVRFLSHEDHSRSFRFYKARRLLAKYAKAKLVVTSRLHCALPCLALGTPVVFIYDRLNDPRLTGLLELLRYHSVEDLKAGRVAIDWDNPAPNPVDISSIAHALRQRCLQFVNRTEECQTNLAAAEAAIV